MKAKSAASISSATWRDGSSASWGRVCRSRTPGRDDADPCLEVIGAERRGDGAAERDDEREQELLTQVFRPPSRSRSVWWTGAACTRSRPLGGGWLSRAVEMASVRRRSRLRKRDEGDGRAERDGELEAWAMVCTSVLFFWKLASCAHAGGSGFRRGAGDRRSRGGSTTIRSRRRVGVRESGSRDAAVARTRPRYGVLEPLE